jgi:hypothetical protein
LAEKIAVVSWLFLQSRYPSEHLDAAARIASQHKYHLPKQLEAIIEKMFSDKNESGIFVSEATQQFVRPADYFIKN